MHHDCAAQAGRCCSSVALSSSVGARTRRVGSPGTLDAPNREGESALHLTCAEGEAGAAAVLLGAGAAVARPGWVRALARHYGFGGRWRSL